MKRTLPPFVYVSGYISLQYREKEVDFI